MQSLPKILIVLGSTASGKSDLAVRLAIKRNGEIVSADSRQVYKGLNIGSGKITKEEMRGIPHHLLDVASPNQIFTASDYARLARKAIDDILRRKKLPIICGGTGFYIDAMLYNNLLAPCPQNSKIRKELDQLQTQELSDKLLELDPVRYQKIDKQNRVRLIRAIEIVLLTGKPAPAINKQPIYDAEKIGILWPMEQLDKRIEFRLDKRLNAPGALNMIEEVARLKFPASGKGLSFKRLYDLGLEYRYISLYLKGDIDYQTMRAELLRAIKQYARRQMTWFKRDKSIQWISPELY